MHKNIDWAWFGKVFLLVFIIGAGLSYYDYQKEEKSASASKPKIEVVALPYPQNILIEECYEKSRPKFDSGVTSTMREGAEEYAQCLESSILILSERIYPP